jgi:hypothetical protein
LPAFVELPPSACQRFVVAILEQISIPILAVLWYFCCLSVPTVAHGAHVDNFQTTAHHSFVWRSGI